MLNVKVEASCVNNVNNTQIKPTAISDKKDTLNVVSIKLLIQVVSVPNLLLFTFTLVARKL